MTEGPNPGTARRGRRDPNLAAEIALQPQVEIESQLNDQGELAPEPPTVLFPGDVLALKATVQITSGDQDSWFTVGIQAHVQPWETGDDTFLRVAPEIKENVLALVYDAEEAIAEARHAFATRKIRPRIQ